MIIDVHTHDFPAGIVARAMNSMVARTEGVLYPAGDGTLDGHLDQMAMAGIDFAVSCPIATRPDMFEGIFRRACAIKEGKLGERARQKIIPFASVHPLDPKVMEHLEAIAAAGLKGIKFHSFYQDFSLADRAFWPVFEKAADLGLVVQCHCGADVGWPMFHGLCGPREIVRLLKNVPGLKFIAAHLGGSFGYEMHATDALLESGAYIDTSVLAFCWHLDEQMRLLRSWPRERILFGTDHPWTYAPEALAWVRSVRDSADWDLLLGENAARLLRLPY